MIKPRVKKLIALTSTGLSFLTSATVALALEKLAPGPLDTPIQLQPPEGKAISPGTPLNTIFQNALTLVFIVATLAVLVMLIWGAFQWITSGGDKEAVGKARSRITAALIGLAILALAFFILAVVGQILGLNLFQDLKITPLTETPRKNS